MLSKEFQRCVVVSLILSVFTVRTSLGQRFTELNAIGIESAYPLSLDWGDFDNDGDLDLGVGDFFDRPSMALYRQTAAFNFENVGGTLPPARMVIWGDYNGDGWLDFVSTRMGVWPNWVSRIYKNDQKGGFTATVSLDLPSNATFADWGDYDNDGDLDLLVSSYQDTGHKAQVWRNEGFDVFTLTAIDLPEAYYSEC